MTRDPEAFVVVDLGFGDAGKGATVDFLVRDRGADLVVRFNGGAQAGHRVVTPDGRAHVFSQLGSGTFVPGVRSHLGERFVLHPLALRVELSHLERAGVSDALARLTIDERALVTTPFHQAMNRLVELARGDGRHGSVGVGFGDTVDDSLRGESDVLRARDLGSYERLRTTLARVQERKRAAALELGLRHLDATELQLLDDPEASVRIADAWTALARQLDVVPAERFDELLRASPRVVFEGAQGVLLDERWGFHPHTTWSDCTFRVAEAMLAAHGFDGAIERLGVVRAYATRHGAGPFPSEDAGYAERLPDVANTSDSFQGAFRCGPLDLVLLRHALAATGGVSGLAVTCLDRLAVLDAIELVDRYVLDDGRTLTRLEDDSLPARCTPVRTTVRAPELLERIEGALDAKVVLASYGPSAYERRWRDSRSLTPPRRPAA